MMPATLRRKIGLLFLFTLFWSVYHEHYRGDFRRTIKIDGIGYNAYLPALFLHDGNLSWNYYANTLDTMKLFHGSLQDFRKPYHGHFINKYPLGLAITQTPFWLGAWGFQGFNKDLTGYESPFQIAVFINNIFWLLLGLYLFSGLLHRKGWSEIQILIFSALFIFATNIFHFITFDNCLTHPVTIGLSLIAFATLSKYSQTGKSIFWIFFLLIFSVLFCIRPVNILMVPFFIFYYFLEEKNKGIPKHWYLIIPAFFLTILLYLGSNKLQTGSWLVYTYQNEKFIWNEWHVADVLFGYRCGVFLYTPILLFSLFLWKFSPDKKIVLAYGLCLAASIFIISCWNEYCYGCRLGNRPLTDYYIFFFIPLLHVKWTFVRRRMIFMFLIFAFCLYYNQILHYQYRHYLLNWCNVQGADFWQVFLQTDRN